MYREHSLAANCDLPHKQHRKHCLGRMAQKCVYVCGIRRDLGECAVVGLSLVMLGREDL